jgi:parallel beta-helix repeat protein
VSANLPVHNLDTWLSYATIQAAIDANETLDGHTITVDAGLYQEHVVVDKSISLIGEDRNNTIIDGGGTGTSLSITADHVSVTGFKITNEGRLIRETDGLRIQGCSYVIISRNIISRNNDGLFIYQSGNVRVQNNLIFDNRRGIGITLSHHNQVVNNTVSAGREAGISMGSEANSNLIINNKIYENDFCGILLARSHHNYIMGTNLSRNNQAGIRLDGSTNNTIVSNHITSHDRDGLAFFGSNSNTVTGNLITRNEWDGINLDESNFNSIYHNNFVNNTHQAGSYSGSQNTWDDGYPSGGNYWTNYDGSDVYKGPHQNETGSDGIGDTRYRIDAKNEDRYPLIDPCPLLDISDVSSVLFELLWSLTADFLQLQSDYDELESRYHGAVARYTSLQTQLDKLQTDYEDLQSEYASLTTELNTTKNIVYTLLITLVLFLTTTVTVYLATRRPKTQPASEAT